MQQITENRLVLGKTNFGFSRMYIAVHQLRIKLQHKYSPGKGAAGQTPLVGLFQRRPHGVVLDDPPVHNKNLAAAIALGQAGRTKIPLDLAPGEAFLELDQFMGHIITLDQQDCIQEPSIARCSQHSLPFGDNPEGNMGMGQG